MKENGLIVKGDLEKDIDHRIVKLDNEMSLTLLFDCNTLEISRTLNEDPQDQAHVSYEYETRNFSYSTGPVCTRKRSCSVSTGSAVYSAV